MARIQDVVVDSQHPSSLARFWASVLNGYAVAPYDEAELGRLRAAGVDSVEDAPTVLAAYDDHVVLADPEGNEFCLLR